MINSFINYLFNLGLNLIIKWGYFGLILGIALTSMLIPIPSEATLGFSGYLVSTDAFNFNIAVLCASLGNLLGSTITYLVSRYFGRAFLLRYGKYVGIQEDKVDRSERFLKKHGDWAIFVAQILPVLGAVISVPAGILKINYYKFAIYTFAGGAIWCAGFIYLGKKLGENWITIASKLQPFESGIKIFALLLIGIFILFKVLKFSKRFKAL